MALAVVEVPEIGSVNSWLHSRNEFDQLSQYLCQVGCDSQCEFDNEDEEDPDSGQQQEENERPQIRYVDLHCLSIVDWQR